MALANSEVDCISGVWLLILEAVSLDWLGVQHIVFVVISIVISIIIIVSSGIVKSSPVSSMTSMVDCISGSCLWKVKAMAGGSPIVISLVVLEFSVIIVGIIISGSSIGKSSLASYAMPAVG